MTTLVCDELIGTLTQEINFNNYRTYHIEGIKIKLLMYNAPSGTFTLSIKDGATTLVSAEFTSADIKTDLETSDNYCWLYKALNIAAPLKAGSYNLVLSSSGYTYSENSFIGWIKSHENIFNDRSIPAVYYTSNPFDVLIYENTREDLVR